jgi:hypothetical protein
MSRPVMEARQSVEREIEQLLADRKRLRIDRPKWLDVTLSKKLEKLRGAAQAAAVDRADLHAIFKSLFVKVVIDWQSNRLRFVWKHGGESSLKVDMKPQRKVGNRRRADRPWYQPGEVAQALPTVPR